VPRITFEWQQARSEASRAAWEARWERAWELGDERSLGPKGKAYIEDKYGAEVQGEEPPEDYYDEYDDLYDFEEEY